MARHIRKGDMVQVIAGDHKGVQARVMRVRTKDQRVMVEGVNTHVKHVRPTQNNPQGGMVRKEMPIHMSNVQPVADGKPTRVRFERRDDGSKVRVAARNGEQLGPDIKKARK